MRTFAVLLVLAVTAAGCGAKRTGVRAPTAAERRALVAAQVRHLGMTSTRCVTFEIAVSRSNPRYARVDEDFHPPFVRGCTVGNGRSLFRRDGDRWHDVGDASDPFPCGYAGASAEVIRSLFGGCGTLH